MPSPVRRGHARLARAAAALPVSLVMALVASLLALGPAPLATAAGSASADSSRLADQLERSRAREAGTADRVGRLEARLAQSTAEGDRLAVALGVAVEAYNGARLRQAQAREREGQARADAARAQEQVATSRRALGRFAAAAYATGGDLTELTLVLQADGFRDLVRRAGALQSVADTRTRALHDLTAAQAFAESQERLAQRRLRESRRAAREVERTAALAQSRLQAHAAAAVRLAGQREVLVRELADARGTTVRLERERQLALEREREEAARRAAEAAARRAAREAEAQRRADESQRRADEAQRRADEQRRAAPTAAAPQPPRAADPTTAPDPPAQQRASDPPAQPRTTTEPAPRPAPRPAPPSAPVGPPAGTSSGTVAGASAALAFARAQVGKAYRWGGDGPESFDCSGLTMRAWEQGGVGLPHYSVAQYAQGTKVALTDVRPGDLVFFAADADDYRTIYHVGIYAGDGQMVEAPFTGENVRVSSIWRGSLFGAVRP